MAKKKYERPLIHKLNTGLMNKFGTRTTSAPITQIDGVPVKRLMEDHGSPVFVFSEKQVRKNYNAALNAFTSRYPKVLFAWSYKTNYLNSICNIFHQEGAWAEVVSGFEFDKSMLNGVPGDRIIFNGPDKTLDELEKAVREKSLIHIDHLDELYALIPICDRNNTKGRVAIRVNMDTGVYPQWDRFGFNYENGQAWDAINKIMISEHLTLEGLHCHIGTFMLSPNAYGVAAAKICELAVRIKQKYDMMVRYIDMGGGFPSRNNLKGSYLPGTDIVPTIDEFAEAIASAILNSNIGADELPLLILESGRALIDEAGYLLGSVIANKRLSDGRRATILNFGVNLLFTSFWYNHQVTPAQEFSRYTEDMELFGPLCMNIDILRENVNLPLLQRGDNVVVQNVGAYNMTQWMQFITLRPNVTLIDSEGQVHLIRTRESLEYINSMEQMPDHLREFKL